MKFDKQTQKYVKELCKELGCTESVLIKEAVRFYYERYYLKLPTAPKRLKVLERPPDSINYEKDVEDVVIDKPKVYVERNKTLAKKPRDYYTGDIGKALKGLFLGRWR